MARERAILRPVREPPTARVDADGFVGREAELRRLDALFEAGRLVTLVGPPGIGKTRLAQQYALRVTAAATAATHGVRVYRCDLGGVRDADRFAAAVSAALELRYEGATPGGSAEGTERLGRALAGRGAVLLVLDNVEQLVGVVAPVVERWLALAPRARALLTSRELLRTPSEQALELPPLGLPASDALEHVARSEAVTLFVERVRRARGDFVLGAADAPAAAEIVRQLDGIPLAIELAAARVSMLGLDAVLARLARRFELLVHGARTGADRQRTLREAIAWSWQLLEPDERATLAQCSVFRGGFTLEAAERVVDLSGMAGGARPVFDTLQALREKSLVRALPAAPGADPTTASAASGPQRFGLYHSIHAYADERLGEVPAHDPGSRPAAAARHAAYYAEAGEALAAQANARGELAPLRTLTAESENLVAAAERALAAGDPARALVALVALEPSVWASGPIEPYLAQLDRALGLGGDAVPAALRAAALIARGSLRGRRGRVDEARADLAAASALASQAGARALEGRAACRLGGLAHQVSAIDECCELYARAARLCRDAGDRRFEAIARLGLAAGELGRNGHAAAEENVIAALELHRALGAGRDDPAEASALNGLGLVRLEQGRVDEARRAFDRALAIHRAGRNTIAEGPTLCYLGMLEHLAGARELAADFYARARVVAEEVGHTHLAGYAQVPAGVLAHEGGFAEQAAARYRASVELLGRSGDRASEAWATAHLAAAEATLGHLEAAEALMARADALFAAVGPSAAPAMRTAAGLHRVHLALCAARLADARGDAAGAAEHRRLARARLREVAPREARVGVHAPRPVEVQLAVRLAAWALAAANARAGEPGAGDASEAQGGAGDEASANAPAAALLVDAEGRWMQLPGGQRVSCSKRQAIRLLLVCLAEQRVHAPGRAVGKKALIAAGWPGERILPDAASGRLRVSLTTLRQLGLRDLLVSVDEGYLLDPRTPVRIVRDERDA